MKRLLAMAVVLGGLIVAAQASAGDLQRGSYGEWVRVNNHGKVTYRYVYRGKTSGYAPPAMFYYGYPQSGFTYGTGLEQYR